METTTSQLDPETLAQLQGLELRARYIVDGYQTGLHRSPYRGHSVEFTEHREYAPGDDLRYVDWKVFGKTDKVYLKQFEAETNLVCYLLVDVSESMSYQSAAAALSKLEYAACLATALAYVVLRQHDSISLATFDEEVCELMSESGNPRQLQQLIHVLSRTEATGKSDIGKSLHEASQRLQRRGVVIVVSDLLGDVESLLMALKHLRYQRHEVRLIQVLDPAEMDFPFSSTMKFQGLESLPDILTEPRSLRKAYLAALKDFLQHLESGCRALQIKHHLARTDEAIDHVLHRALPHEES